MSEWLGLGGSRLCPQARAHNGLGHSYHATGDSSQARHQWQEALIHYTEIGAPEADQVRAQLAATDNSPD